MEKWIRGKASNIAQSLGMDAEREAVVAYGLIAIVQIAITLILVLLIGLALGIAAEAMMVCLSVSILRKYSGGAHADTAEFCTVFSIVHCTVSGLLSRWFAQAYHQGWMLAAILLVYAVAFAIAWRYVPVDSPNKPIRTAKKKRRMRVGSFLLLGLYLILSAVFYVFSPTAPGFRSLGISLLLGVSWQVLTLTPVGAILLHKLNELPKYLRKETKP